MKTREQIIAKEQKELAKWKKMKAQPVRKGYMILMVVVISIVYLLDAMATDLHSGLSELEITYFSQQLGLSYEVVLSLFSIVGTLTIVINLIAPFYKALADKIGRKALFMISTVGMGIGLLLGYFSTNLVIYVIGRVILTFFVIADIQVIYIMEVAKPDKRAQLLGVTKFLSILGTLIIPLCRDLLLDPSGSNWRDVCIIPTLLAIVSVFLIALFIRESDVFLDQKIAYLERPYEEREEERIRMKQNKQIDTNKGSLGTAIRYIFKDKQLGVLVISYGVLLLGMCSAGSFYNTIFMQHGMDTDAITATLYTYPISSALVTLLGGFLSDKLGRKTTSVINGSLALLSMIGCGFLPGIVHPFIIGIFRGMVHGCFWCFGDTISMMIGESARTEIRSSTTAATGFVTLIASMVSSIVYGIVLLFVDLNLLCIIGGAVTIGAALLIVCIGAKETKGKVLV